MTLKTLQKMPKDGHLYVIFGEWHEMPSYSVLQAALAITLSEKYRTNVSIENAFNGPAVDLLNSAEIQRAHANGSPVSANGLFRALFENNIHTSFVDAAVKFIPDPYIDQENPYTFEMVKSVAPQMVGQNISVLSKDGVYIRNKIMVEKTTETAKSQKSKITILNTGMSHVGGDGIEKYPYDQSLAHLFKEAISKDDRLLIIAPTLQDFDDLILKDLMPSQFFSQHSSDTIIVRGIDNQPFDLQYPRYSYKKEITHLKKLTKGFDPKLIKTMTTLGF
jgi:hypothetical protein